LSAKGEGPALTKHYFVSFFIKRLERGEAYFCLDFLLLFYQEKSMKRMLAMPFRLQLQSTAVQKFK